jgi:outer membrane receptor protein involved in Fe transport
VRVEKFSREISEFQLDVANIPNIVLDTVDVFFSSNLSYSINTENLVRLSYGRTVNRPEFREIAPFYFNDFDLNAGVWGNDTLLGCYIDNYDLRYEWYPSAGEMVSLAFFHKIFKNPIEIGQIKTGSGFDYKPFNTENAVSSGIELDVRKSLEALGEKESFIRYLKNFTLVFNASLIKSEITTDIPDARERKREMAGQSPYILNGGLYYNSEKEKLMISLVYNRIGRRIAFVGTIDDPHTWELARNALDLTLTKGLYKGLELRLGIKDIFNEPVHRLQYETVTVQSTGEVLNLEQTTFKYRPGTQYTAGLSYKF